MCCCTKTVSWDIARYGAWRCVVYLYVYLFVSEYIFFCLAVVGVHAWKPEMIRKACRHSSCMQLGNRVSLQKLMGTKSAPERYLLPYSLSTCRRRIRQGWQSIIFPALMEISFREAGRAWRRNEEKDEKKKSLVDSGSDTLWIYL